MPAVLLFLVRIPSSLFYLKSLVSQSSVFLSGQSACSTLFSSAVSVNMNLRINFEGTSLVRRIEVSRLLSALLHCCSALSFLLSSILYLLSYILYLLFYISSFGLLSYISKLCLVIDFSLARSSKNNYS